MSQKLEQGNSNPCLDKDEEGKTRLYTVQQYSVSDMNKTKQTVIILKNTILGNGNDMQMKHIF